MKISVKVGCYKGEVTVVDPTRKYPHAVLDSIDIDLEDPDCEKVLVNKIKKWHVKYDFPYLDAIDEVLDYIALIPGADKADMGYYGEAIKFLSDEMPEQEGANVMPSGRVKPWSTSKKHIEAANKLRAKLTVCTQATPQKE